MNGGLVTLTYDEFLDMDSAVPANEDYSITADGEPVALRSGVAVVVAGRQVTLTLAAAVLPGQTVLLSYTPDANPIQDQAGNDAEALSNEAVINETPDTTAPSFTSATVNGAALTLAYDEALDENSLPAGSAFTVTVDDTEVDLATGAPVAIAGQVVTLTLVTAVTPGQTVTVSYAVPGSNPIQDAAGNDAARVHGRERGQRDRAGAGEQCR